MLFVTVVPLKTPMTNIHDLASRHEDIMSNKFTLAMHFSHASLSKLGSSADDGECQNVSYCLAVKFECKVSNMLRASYWFYMLGNITTWRKNV